MTKMISRAIFTALVAVAASVSLSGPVRLATTFFIPAGRTNPVVLDAKADASGNLVTAALADVTGGQQIVITKFNAAGVRRWARMIDAPFPVNPVGQVAGKFQISLDGAGNTYVLSPRAGNPDYPGTTEDLLLRKINDSGATVGNLSLVRFVAERTGEVLSVRDGQMQATRRNATDLGLAVTAVRTDGLASVFLLVLDGSASRGTLAVPMLSALRGYNADGPVLTQIRDFRVVGLTQSGTPSDPTVGLVVKHIITDVYFGYLYYTDTVMMQYVSYVEPNDSSLRISGSHFVGGGDLYQAEGLGSSDEQHLVLSRFYDILLVTRLETTSLQVDVDGVSSVPHTATRVGDNWLLYGQSATGAGEFFLKYPSVGYLTATSYPISDAASAPYYSGASLVASRGRAYLAGGPTVAGVQGLYSSFSSDGELVYSAGVRQPFTLSTSFVVPTVNNRFWAIGKTSTGLQAVTLWREPDYFVGISAPSSAGRGDTATVKAHLNAPAPIGGYTFPVSVSSKLQNAPSTVTVGEGETSVTFTVKVKSTATAGPATVTARTNTTLDVNTAHTATIKVN